MNKKNNKISKQIVKKFVKLFKKPFRSKPRVARLLASDRMQSSSSLVATCECRKYWADREICNRFLCIRKYCDCDPPMSRPLEFQCPYLHHFLRLKIVSNMCSADCNGSDNWLDVLGIFLRKLNHFRFSSHFIDKILMITD